MLKIILIIVAVIILLILGISIYYGAFNSINIKKEKKESFWIVFEPFVGPYKNTGPVMDKLYYKLLNDESIETFKGFGIYYDNPREVEELLCRSIVGSIIEEKDLDKIDFLKNKGYKILKIKESEYVTSEFTYKGKLSIIFGIFKVYPKLSAYLEKNNSVKAPMMEIYDIPNKMINYLTPTSENVFPKFDDLKK